MRVEGVAKRYTKLSEQAMLLRSILPVWRPSRTDLWALRDLDFTIERGETVGILGRNGAGKTTLLRLLAGVTRPSRGRVQITGRIAPLISVGVGFHPEMSGRENVYVNGMLLGLSRREVELRFDEIVAFAELEEFIDTPVKFYSSGMFMRLGFSVAVHVDPDVLLVDEVLAVGDIGFQLKCFERMRRIQSQGATILLVSHSMHAIRALCPRALLLRRGEIVYDGDAGEAIARHHQLLSASSDEAIGAGEEHTAPPVRVTDRRLDGRDGPTFHPSPDEPVTYRAHLEFDRPVDSPQVVFRIYAEDGTLAFATRTLAGDWRKFTSGDETDVEINFRCRLGGGTYRLTLIVTDRDGRDLYEDFEGLLIYAGGRPGTIGIADLEADVEVDGQNLRFPELMLDQGIEEAAATENAN